MQVYYDTLTAVSKSLLKLYIRIHGLIQTYIVWTLVNRMSMEIIAIMCYYDLCTVLLVVMVQ